MLIFGQRVAVGQRVERKETSLVFGMCPVMQPLHWLIATSSLSCTVWIHGVSLTESAFKLLAV
jgi:hypothetical protein